MSVNNLMYQMYKQMTQGYKLGKDGEGLFEHAVKCWLDLKPDNPFPEDSEAYEHFFRMKNYYNVWQLGGADKKISMRRLLNAAKDLCDTKTKNPYKYDKKAAEEERAAVKENALKAEEESLKAIQEAERLKAEHEEEVRQIMEDLNRHDAENNERINHIQEAVQEANEKFKNEDIVDRVQKQYVFNVLETPTDDLDVAMTEEPELKIDKIASENNKPEKKAEKKGWLKRLLKR